MKDPFEVARNLSINFRTAPQVTRYFHSSVILDRKGKIIGQGVNHFRGNIISTPEGPIQKTIHSEIHALEKVNIRRLEGATIVNYGKTNVASILSRPCDNCWAILQKLGFRKVFYTVRADIHKPLWKEEYF